MSGPMALEPGGPGGPGGTREDALSPRLADARTLTLALPGGGPRREAVDRLAAELSDRIAPAVHPYEVAALLESEGLTGETVRDRYGHPDLFSLAAALFASVPRAHPEPPRPADPWRPDHVRCALRGALFALPGLAYALAGRLLPSDGALRALVVAGLVSWAWNQALGHRAYLRLAAGSREAGRTLLKGAPLGAAAACSAGALLAGPGRVAGAVAVQSAYLAAAGVLLVLGRERLLLAALLPVAAGAAALPWWEPGDPVRAGLPLLSLAGAVAAAGRALRGALAAPPAPGADRPRPLTSLPYGLFGLAAGVLVLLAGRHQPWWVVVLTVSMGPAEWLLYRCRGLTVAALRAARTVAGFRLRAGAVLAGCLLCYVGPLVPAALLTGADPLLSAALAATLWTALLLQAFGVAWPPALLCLAAAGAAAPTGPGPHALAAGCAVAALCLTGGALWLLGRPAAHA
ncbi:hypothetical protein [Streptomyces sp. NRRL F-5065]|uniref:hypothetical protein n=1 Tax=Streptomyces sp. NRRL F-5065 TaxID=1463855 RepID=UPI0004C1B4DC|nr:hypothetical protein [Streptomyces sp. NRRL F-5065]